jgi:acyl-CoA synthetase (AMP-forming)/AMP-acid ligase II
VTEYSIAPPVPFSSLRHLLEHHAKRIPDAPAILAPGREPLSYRGLHWQVGQIGRTLRANGIGRHDRVVVVLPNGPEMAVATLAVAASAVSAPVNPTFEARELEKYFADLRPRALLTEAGVEGAARRTAVACGMRIVEVSTDQNAEAGLFTLTGDQGGTLDEVVSPVAEVVSPGDVALLLLTSGTTAGPKIVPLTHANICASAYHWGAAMALTETDRCLNMVPLFHAAFVANILASLAAGASVVCAPGFDPGRFFSWLTLCRPTWYGANPPTHRAIVAEAPHHREQIADCRLRFIRSSSAPLPPRELAELEQTFATPVVQTYGMTETASGPVAANPLPPGRRKPGSVGVPVGLEVAIIDEAGGFLPAGRTGQVVVRGASVMAGYDGDPAAANRDAFAGDWFKTRDIGFFDGDGYLFLVGRSEETIFRGDVDRVAPREVEEALLEHPAVAEAVAFAVPHPALGEEVAAAVTLRPGAMATPNEIRGFVVGRLADFKVPREVLVVAQLPKGPTGKVQRAGLAAKLGIESPVLPQQTFVEAPPRERAKLRPPNYASLPQKEQWEIDKRLGILDWDGT